jgi:ubiquinone/menaquinone biosynthesis C-methylase UbiE
VRADAQALPFADGSFDLAFAAYGALQFVAEPERVVADVARVLRPGGRWVCSMSHPVRWCFPDDPGPAGLVARMSYWNRAAYVEEDGGRATYVESHRTLAERVREVVSAGLVVVQLVEPPWPPGHERTWGGWSPLRGRIVPGTLVVVARRP